MANANSFLYPCRILLALHSMGWLKLRRGMELKLLQLVAWGWGGPWTEPMRHKVLHSHNSFPSVFLLHCGCAGHTIFLEMGVCCRFRLKWFYVFVPHSPCRPCALHGSTMQKPPHSSSEQRCVFLSQSLGDRNWSFACSDAKLTCKHGVTKANNRQ